MRPDLEGRNPVKLADAVCGCERYEVDNTDVSGHLRRSVVCLHTCGQNLPPRAPRKRDGDTAAAAQKRTRNRK